MSHSLRSLGPTSLVAVILLLFVGGLQAEVFSIRLPGERIDFAFNPQSGDIMAVNAKEEQVQLFRQADLKAKVETPAATASAPASPGEIIFKRFGNLQLFLVVSPNDRYLWMYDGASGALVQKFDLGRLQVHSLASSPNPADRFVYYCYGVEGNQGIGTIDISTRTNLGTVYEGAGKVTLTASGDIAYVSGNYMSSLMVHAVRGRKFETKPKFVELPHDTTPQTITLRYLPDPFDRYTAVCSTIMPATLDKELLDLDVAPLCFFKKRPLLLGMRLEEAAANSPGGNVVRALSYNNFKLIGDSLTFDGFGGFVFDDKAWYGYKNISRTRCFADDARDQMVVATADRFLFYPLADFNLPEEVSLLAELEGPRQVAIGQDHTFTLVPSDPKATFSVVAKPEGMRLEGKTFKWRPQPDQVGVSKIVIQMKNEKDERAMEVSLTVTLPSIELPFAPSDFVVSTDNSTAAIWEGPPPSNSKTAAHDSSPPPPPRNRLATIDLKTGAVIAQSDQKSPIAKVGIARSYIVVSGEKSGPAEILSLAKLDRLKQIDLRSPLESVTTSDDAVAIQMTSGIDVYSLKEFQLERQFVGGTSQRPTHPMHLPTTMTRHGIYTNGVLLGGDLQPALIMFPGTFPALEGGNAWQPSFMQQDTLPAGRRVLKDFVSVGDPTTLAIDQAHGRNLQFSLESRGSFDLPSKQLEIELSLIASGDVNERQKFYHVTRALEYDHPKHAHLRATDKAAFVVFENMLYRWDAPPAAIKNDTSSPTFVPQQSALTLSGTGKMVLKHPTFGGKSGAMKFALQTRHPAMTIDEKSGDVTIDEKKLLPDVFAALEAWVGLRSRDQSHVDALRSQVVFLTTRGTELLGRKPRGTPVAIPIRLDVNEAGSLKGDTLQYYLIAELPSNEVIERMRGLDQEKDHTSAAKVPARAALPLPAPVQPPAGVVNPKGESPLERRVESLERRLDLITRQLNELLRLQDEKLRDKK